MVRVVVGVVVGVVVRGSVSLLLRTAAITTPAITKPAITNDITIIQGNFFDFVLLFVSPVGCLFRVIDSLLLGTFFFIARYLYQTIPPRKSFGHLVTSVVSKPSTLDDDTFCKRPLITSSTVRYS